MRYGNDVLSGDWRHPKRGTIPTVEAQIGVVVEDPASGFCGAVVACGKTSVTLEDRHGKTREFRLDPAGFLLDGKPVTLVRPSVPARAPRRSASGSTTVEGLRAKVAKQSRIYVEGVHDAALVERVWGHDLRVEGVVVEYLEGVDDLPAIVAEFAPEPGRRLGVLVDHLVPGSKESRIAAEVADDDVLIVGHPFIDIWEAVKPAALGIDGWPRVPRGTPWKEGVIAALGWNLSPAEAWRRILAAVDSFRDLEPELLGRVEELIDFVTEPGTR
ncbi:MAG TPA: DUF3097 domain-containing protein [Stackebrandtia sp.]|jgi:hypothetical protein|uniref:DUF3097 domain-containing protein n=1 Tax=Stackebrandtia sp. TaxID=2023065 RepID=UPI002D552CE7|nr:DUF3097 domain-containing protein [Stackebrandtia sp.]HZE40077.1 DUF3097 domain-containing protein [Stackebrandtia sp.]